MTMAAGAEVTADSGEDHDAQGYDPSLPPLDSRVISVVRSSPNLTIRPALLSSELGISIEDASSELCGLLRAVGGGEGGATFTFEAVGGNAAATTMVFTFPADFESRARSAQRKDNAKQTLLSMLDVIARAVKVFTAFGLIISLAVLSIASILAMIAALIALARGGGGDNHHRSALMRRIRSMFFTLRQMLWCYAVFGPGLDSGQDPFLRETVTDLYLVLSMFCGNPFSFRFWWRANLLSRRRRRWGQGWGSRHSYASYESDEGVYLIRQGEWGQNGSTSRSTATTIFENDEHRGLLSVVVEFLFGPTPFWPGPSEADRWKLRGWAIMTISSTPNRRNGVGLTLDELASFCDNPPASLDDEATVVSEGLRVVSHFNGLPAGPSGETEKRKSTAEERMKFLFPELMAEGTIPKLDTLEDGSDSTASSWESIFYSAPSYFETTGQMLGGSTTLSRRNECPKYLVENQHTLTKLQRKQFGQCCLLGFLNLIGIIWLRQSIGRGGLLEISTSALFGVANGVLSVLYFYARLFFVLPAGRFAFIVVCNYFISQRNKRRSNLSKALSELST